MSFYTLLMTVLYSIIPHKTPWNMLSFLHGMTILGGVGAAVLIGSFRKKLVKVMVHILLAVGCLHLLGQSWKANFKYRADSRNPYAYVHTCEDFLSLVKRIEKIATVHPEGKNMLVMIVAPDEDMWPLPWYLRAYGKVGYWETVESVPAGLTPPIIISSPDFREKLVSRISSDYQWEHYGLRPGVLLNLIIRKDIWKKTMELQSLQIKDI